MVIFCQNLRFSERSGNVVNRIASYTFPIYLLHIMVKNLLVRQGFTLWLEQKLMPLPLSAVWYAAILVLIVFLLTLLLCVILRRLKNLLFKNA